MATPSIKVPTSYTHTLNFGGGLAIFAAPMSVNSLVTGDKSHPVATHVTGDKSQPVGTHVTGDKSQPIGTHVTGDKSSPVATLVTGDPNQPIGSQVELLNIPRLSKQDMKDLLTPEIRVHIPHYNQVCLKFLGMEVLTLCFSGESQVITEPYVPNAYERCEGSCCEPDTRPFPQRPGIVGDTFNPNIQGH